MDANTLWTSACELMRPHMNEISFNTWVKSGLTPLKLDGGTMTLLTPADYMKSMISGRYLGMITNALTEAAGRPISAVILLPGEAQETEIRTPSETKGRQEAGSMPLNPKYTFQNFVVGNNNRLAHAAALAVAEQPATSFNPLFIYGGVGLGKTHLMHAIGHFILEEHPDKRLLYITSEDFTNEMISAIQSGRNASFKQRFRQADVLMVDDIQFIAGRDTTQEEFFHTFNALQADGKQIILTSDRPPKDIARLEERLRSRFEGGLITDIQRPDLDTRVAILRKKAMDEHIVADDAVLELIASKFTSSIRELEGGINRVRMYAELMGKPITPELCEEALRGIVGDERRVITSDVIIQATADYYSLAPDDLTGSSRRREITVPRQIAMYLCRSMADMSLPQIGQAFGGRDHSTVLYSCNLVDKNIKTSVNVRNLVEDIRTAIREGK